MADQLHADPVRGALAQAMASPELSRLWDRHYIADKDDNPAVDVVAALEHADQFDLRDDPDLLAFLIKFCEVELTALGEAQDGDTADVTQSRAMASTFYNYLQQQAEGLEIPVRDDLPDTYQHFLSMMEKETAQVPFRPMRGFINIMKHIAEHVNEHRKEHPWGFRSLVLGAVGYVGLVYWKVGSSATNYIEPELFQIDNLDSIFDDGWAPTFDPNAPIPEEINSCHDHVQQMFAVLGDDASTFIANGIRDTLDMGGLFPQHCSKLRNLAEVAQERAEGMYDFWNTRIAIFIEDGQLTLADKALPDGSFKDGFLSGANYMAEGIYAGNTMENIILHGMIGLTSYAMTVKIGMMDDHESSEAKGEIKNFLNRTVKNAPLTYAFAAAGTLHGYMQTSSVMDPQTVWTGIGGAIAGHMVHKTIKARNKKETVSNWMRVAKDTLKDEAALAGSIVSDLRAGEQKYSNPVVENQNFWKRHKWKVAGGLTAAFAAADTQMTGGYINGLVSGGATVLAPFLAFNVVEDTTAHFIFGIGGATAGMMHVGIARGLRRIFGKTDKAKHQDVEHDHHHHVHHDGCGHSHGKEPRRYALELAGDGDDMHHEGCGHDHHGHSHHGHEPH